jgi:glycolate oxidase
MDRHILKELKKIVGEENLTTAREDLLCYSYDGTGQTFLPAAIAFPANTKEISAIMKLATRAQFPVVPRGAATGMTGGSLPIRGGLVLAMNRLNNILEIDEQNHVAMVEPGVINGDFREQLKEKSLFYPPDPASLEFCTMGGNVAECAGGPSAVKYGVTRDYVLGLEVVLPDGRVMRTGVRTAKGVVGYDLTRLFIGSEGTLGIITRITVKLVSLPTAKKTFLASCSSLAGATRLVTHILKNITPCTLEYLDNTALQIVRGKIPFTLDPKVKALLLIEVDGDPVSVETQAERLKHLLQDQKELLSLREAATTDEIDSLWTARRAVSPSAFNLKPDKISEDIVVPRANIPQLVEYAEHLSHEYNIPIFTFGHAGDGNIHVNIMLDKNNLKEVDKAQAAKKKLFKEVIALSGTLSGEHGVGITKAPFISMELDQTSMDVMQSLKIFFDPHNILNPGKIFPTENKN